MAGSIIGKGGSNISKLRNEVSIYDVLIKKKVILITFWFSHESNL